MKRITIIAAAILLLGSTGAEAEQDEAFIGFVIGAPVGAVVATVVAVKVLGITPLLILAPPVGLVVGAVLGSAVGITYQKVRAWRCGKTDL